MARPRWALRAEAVAWRFLMNIGMILHRLAPPMAPDPAFREDIRATVSPIPGTIGLAFYTPANYAVAEKPFPVVVNFHGGGFTLGKSTDDARWARTVTEVANAVVVSVDYRRAPEFPFPTAVEDGVDAILHLIHNAERLKIDEKRIAVSGFSAGGNMAFTVPLRLDQELKPIQDSLVLQGDKGQTVIKTGLKTGVVVAIAAWYPSTDFTRPREERRATNPRVDKELPRFFTKLFDDSYLFPPKTIDLSSPYLSPGVAPAEMLKILPKDIIMYTCEYDELQAEGERFKDRLVGQFGKGVRYKMIEKMPHGFDKSPNPLKWDPETEKLYREASTELRKVFEEHARS